MDIVGIIQKKKVNFQNLLLKFMMKAKVINEKYLNNRLYILNFNILFVKNTNI